MGRRKKEDSGEQPKPKERKITAGPLREKSRTKARLVATVGKVIQKYGYPGLTLANIGKESGLDRKLVYAYFGSVDNLVESYLQQKNIWNVDAKDKYSKLILDPDKIGRLDVKALLMEALDQVYKDKALQRILHWELGEKNKVLRKFIDRREDLSDVFLKFIDKDFESTAVDLRAILALQVAGVYFLTMQAKGNGGAFCGIDISENIGKERIQQALEWIIDNAYNIAKVKK